MKRLLGAFSTWLAGLLLFLGAANPAWGINISRRSADTIYTDPTATPPALQCQYAAYAISNDTTTVNYSNIWVKVDSFTGTVVRLGGGDTGIYALDNLPAGQTKMAYVYLWATNITATAQNHTVRVYNGYPGIGTELTNVTFSVTADSPGQNNSSKISSVTYSPTTPTVGGLVTVSVNGDCGQVGNNDVNLFTAACFTNWNAAAFQLVNASLWLTNKNNAVSNVVNYLVLPSGMSQWSAGQLTYQAYYQFRAIAVTASSTPVSPITLNSQGSKLTHTDTGTLGSFNPVQVPTNTTLLSKLASVTQLYTNETLTYTARFNNNGTNDMYADRVVDTLPAGVTYVAGSSKFNGTTILDPYISGNVLTWSQAYSNPANSTRDLTFQATVTSSGYTTNSVVAFAGNTEIDTSYDVSNNVPATVTVRVLLAPTAVNDTGTLLEDAVLTVAAPGVLGNDVEPNGFAMTVINSTPATHGTATVNANGSYTYTPAANYNGSDSFTYTLTNGNARTSTATVNLTVTAVNDPPTLNPISNLTLNEDAGLQTVNLSGISAGPSNESSQTLTVTAASSNPSLIPNPTVNYTSPNASGTLTFTPVANAYGSATITVVVQDNGGTSNGGVDAVTNTFTVTVNSVNDAPTLNAIANMTITENAGLQTVNLSGISTGPANESGQTLTVTASSSNPSLIPAPTVNYTSPNATGTLTFTPAACSSGSSTLTVIVKDNGGTSNGGVDAVTNTFTVTVQAVANTTWGPGGSYTCNVTNATGVAGTGYSLLAPVTGLDVQATSGSPFTINLVSYNGASPGQAANFNNNNSYTWTIATAPCGVTGFSTDKFVINTSGFSNDLAGGVFAISNYANAILLVFTPNPPPVANLAYWGRGWGTSLRITTSQFLTAFTSDPNGYPRALYSVGPGTNGSYIGTNSTYILYAPTNNFPEQFPYVVCDVNSAYRPGDTVRKATNYLVISVTNAVGSAQSITSSGSAITVRFAGVPGYKYVVERASQAAGPWTTLDGSGGTTDSRTNAPSGGVWLFSETPPYSPAFYRVRQNN
jgi:VCBS repeat-containing protein